MAHDSGEAARLLEIIAVQNRIAASDLDLDEVMSLTVELAVTLTAAGGAAIATPEGPDLVYRAAGGPVSPELGSRYPLLGSLGGLSLEERRVLRSDDCSTDPRVDAEVCHRIGARSIICVPLVHNDEVLGVLTAYARTADYFSGGEVRALELVGETISAHLHHARSFAVVAHRSLHDSLTGLFNRRAYEERLPAELARAARAEEPLSLCLLDLDGFKAINDRQGHLAGDEVLRAIAGAVKRTRISDQVFRIGGDEFAVLLPGCSRADAEAAISRLLVAIDVGPIVELEPGFGISFGIASGEADARSLHAAADARLLEAKHQLYTERLTRSRGGGPLRTAA